MNAELDRLRCQMVRALDHEEDARESLERTLRSIGSDRPCQRDSDDYEAPPVSVAAHY